jgi:serine/threonine protein kinase
MASISVAPVDFTSPLCAYLELDIDAYPECVRSTVIRMRNLRESTLCVRTDSKLGQGSSATVYLGHYEDKRRGKIFCAVKVFKTSGCCLNEIEMLWKTAGVANVVAFHGPTSFKPTPPGKTNAVVMDYIEDPVLHLSVISPFRPDSFQADATELCKQLLEFLAEIKKPAPNRPKGLIHGDLCDKNLFWRNRKLTIIDLNLMVEKGSQRDRVVQKKRNRAPEIFLNQTSESNFDTKEDIRYTEAVDMWSVGVIVHEFVTKMCFIMRSETPSPHGHIEISTLVYRIGKPDDSYLNGVNFLNKKKIKPLF